MIERARRGDVAAFGELVRTHRDVAFRVAWSIAPAYAEEALQEGCIKAFRSLDRFRDDAPWRPWFIRIVANEAKNGARSASRRLRLAHRSWDPTLLGAVPAAEDEVVRRAEADAVIAAFHRLEEPHRSVVVCRVFLELSVAETAEILEIPAGTVKSRLARALERLEAMV